jgi:hypothetical protein
MGYQGSKTVCTARSQSIQKEPPARLHSYAPIGHSSGAKPLKKKACKDSPWFQCQAVGPSHDSLTWMQDAATIKQQAQNLLTSLQPRPPNEVRTVSFAPFSTSQILLGEERALFWSTRRTTKRVLVVTETKMIDPRSHHCRTLGRGSSHPTLTWWYYELP